KGKKYNIVIGNPPYGPTSVSPYMKRELIPFAFAENNFQKDSQNIKFNWSNTGFEGEVPTNEKNIGKVNDLYAYFLGAANLYCEDNGIISYITSNTYLTIPTYKWFRKYLLENFAIEYIVNFNAVSEKGNSMFFPDAGIENSIIIMRKAKPKDGHVIKYLDLSNLKSIKEKFEAFCDVKWGKKEGQLNKNNIKSFKIKSFKDINFKTMVQQNILRNKNFVFSFGESNVEELLNKIEGYSIPITTYSLKNTGVDVGDLTLVNENKDDLKSIIMEKVFKGELKDFGSTLRKHVSTQLRQNKIDKNFKDKKVTRFVYQKHMIPYGMQRKHWTYMDPDILWRSRINNRSNLKDNPIFQPVKLFILERRSKGQILSLVTKDNIVPQHGGRFMYLVTN